MLIERPSKLRINAWDGCEVPVFDFPVEGGASIREFFGLPGPTLAPLRRPSFWDWRHRNVGWGLVLRDNPGVSAKDKAAGADAPEPIRRLLAARPGAPVLRYLPNKPLGQLCRYFSDGKSELVSTAAPDWGIYAGQIPKYLLIYGSPAEVPWSVQFMLNSSAFVGRLDLKVEEGLGRYVDALICDWTGHDQAEIRKPVVWSADWGAKDATFLLARAVGGKLAERFAVDPDLSARSWLTKDAATRDALGDALRTQRPGFICTTSHGMTGTLDDAQASLANLGSPVDNARQTVELSSLGSWQPGGAIWYSHACCSAGSNATTRYADLIPLGQGGGQVLQRIAAVAGARVAPLPRALLGAPNPLGAFVGHVEPTFDWTLRDPFTKQVVTHTIIRCLYDRLFTVEHPAPIGWALADIFAEVGNFLAEQVVDDRDDQATLNIYRKLAAIDRQSIVILGDPTVTLRGSAAWVRRGVNP